MRDPKWGFRGERVFGRVGKVRDPKWGFRGDWVFGKVGKGGTQGLQDIRGSSRMQEGGSQTMTMGFD